MTIFETGSSVGGGEAFTVMVTGAAGYVGSVCCDILVRDGIRVIAYDNLSEGHRKAVHPEAAFVLGDIARSRQLRQVFSQHRIDVVMHFAATAMIDDSNPREFFRNNVCAFQTLIDEMLNHGVKHLIYSSSASVYGEPIQIPIREDHPKIPINSYGESKWMCERILHWYQKAYGLNYIALRYFNAAGATERCGEARRCETHIVPLLLKSATGELSWFTIHGKDYPTRDGTCIRDYVHVADIAQAHILALRNIQAAGAASYNLGNGVGFSVLDVVECARQITGVPIPVRIGPRRQGDPATLLADSTRIRDELGWKPLFSDLGQIISSAWKWKQQHPSGYGIRTPERSGSRGSCDDLLSPIAQRSHES